MTLNYTVEQAALRYAEALVKYHATRSLEKSENEADRRLAKDMVSLMFFAAEDVNTAAVRQAELQAEQIVQKLI